MYLDYFGLNRFPFSIAPDPDLLFLSPAHNEALAHLNYALTNHGGLICLTGEVGMGKTTLCRAFIDQVPPDIDVAYIFNPMLSAPELLQSICDELEVASDQGGDGTVLSNKALMDVLYRELIVRYSQGRKVICIIDEAQSMPAPLLEQIRLLTNLETNKDKLLTLILVGQPELQATLAQHHVRQLDQRITARYHLSAMSHTQLQPYLQHRLNLAGCSHELFSPKANRIIWQASKGIPRLINSIADRALLGVYATGKKTVDQTIARQAVIEVLGKQKPKTSAHAPLEAEQAGLVYSLLKILLVASLTAALAFVLAVKKDFLLGLIKTDNHFQVLAQAYGLSHDLALDDCLKIKKSSYFSCLAIDWPLSDLKKLKRPLSVFDGLTWRVVLPEALLIKPQQVVLLWDELEGYKKPLRPGESSAFIPWLRETLQKRSSDVALTPAQEGTGAWQIIAPKGQPIENVGHFYDPLLAMQVADFQRRVGLKDDRIVGLKTLLVLQDIDNGQHEVGK